MKYHVKLTRQAEQDIDGILTWISNRSPQGAAAWLRCLEAMLAKLVLIADRCQLAPENEDHDAEIRQMLFKTRAGRRYRALFIIRYDSVLIIHVRGPGQDLLSPEEVRIPE